MSMNAERLQAHGSDPVNDPGLGDDDPKALDPPPAVARVLVEH
jgi:hypothetical protein